jgi:hypothetical protein
MTVNGRYTGAITVAAAVAACDLVRVLLFLRDKVSISFGRFEILQHRSNA